jgi:2,4-dienoyl-CoA reductase-like NADH-dependent reductase (Old Yellow Enzyme family)
MGVFDPITLNGMTARNRFVRSATWEGLAEPDGRASARLEAVMAALSAGGVGLVISGHAYVEKRGQAGPWQLGAHTPGMIPGLARLARAVHARGGRFVVQLAHAGCRANPELTGEPAVGPSASNDPSLPPCREMTPEDLARVQAAFGAAAAICREAGADGVQIHAAHGYGLSQFLAPRTNHRVGAYGGTLENRARMLLEVMAAIRGRVGYDYPILVKLNSEDFLEGGLSRDESRKVASWLDTAGCDAVELSGGTLDAGPCMSIRRGPFAIPEGEAWYRQAAAAVKAETPIPLILVGGIRSLETAEELVDSGTTDLVALSRPLIREPGLVARWQSGDRAPSACISDNACFVPARKGEGIYCLTEVHERKMRERGAVEEAGDGKVGG